MILLLALLVLSGCAVRTEAIYVRHCELSSAGEGPASTPCYLKMSNGRGKLFYANRAGELESMQVGEP